MVPKSGAKPFCGSSVVMRHWMAKPRIWMSAWEASPISGSERRYPCATRIWACTRLRPVIISVTVCSTWMRGFTSMK